MATQHEPEPSQRPATGWGGSATTRAASAAPETPRLALDPPTPGPRRATDWPGRTTSSSPGGPAASTERRRRNEYELRLQIWLVDHFRALVDPRDAIILALENGEERAPETLDRLHRKGLVDGTPDLVIVYFAGQVLWVEVKLEATLRHRRTELSAVQQAVHDQLQGLGHVVQVVRSAREFWALLKLAGIPFKEPPPEQLALFKSQRKPDTDPYQIR